MQAAEAYRLLMADVYELAGASRRTSAALAAEQGHSVAGWHLLSVLSERPLTVSAAARRLGLARQGVQRTANSLLAPGLLALEDNPDHKTAPLFRLTADGWSALAGLVAAADRQRTARLEGSGCSAAELQQARDVLRRVLIAVTEP